MCKTGANMPENTFEDHKITPKHVEEPTLFLLGKKSTYEDIRPR